MKEKKIANVGYHMDKDLLPVLLQSEFGIGITYNTIAQNKDEAINLRRLAEYPL